MVPVPFLTRTITESTAANAQFVTEGEMIPLSKLSLKGVELAPAKCQTLVVTTSELVDSLTPAALTNLRGLLTRSVVRGLDLAFLDPASSPIVGGRPGSITNAIAPSSSTGATAAAFTSDIKAALNRLIASGSDLATVTLLLHPHIALWASTLTTTGGALMFPRLGARGGEAFGVPVLVSAACLSAGSPGEYIAVACDPQKLLFADENQIVVDTSRQANVVMDDAPSNAASSTSACGLKISSAFA